MALNLAALLAIVAFLLCRGPLANAGRDSAPSENDAARSNCHIAGLQEQVVCLAFDVPLNWQRPGDDGQIRLQAALIPALSGRAQADPLIILAGGPGQAAMDYGPLVVSAFAQVRKSRDIVLLDQRGTGRSSPSQCPIEAAPFNAMSNTAIAREIRECAAASDIDVRHLGSADVVQDIERLRQILGADVLNLWGGSFGTRLAQHYAREYPQRVRSVVLDAALPVGTSLFATAPTSAEEAWQKLLEACRADSLCQARFPSLEESFATLLDGLDGASHEVEIIDPTSGATSRIVVDRSLASETVRGALYVPRHAALLPFAINEAGQGNYSPLAALAHATSAWAADTMYLGATLSILCSEEVPAVSPRQAAAAAGSAFVRDTYHRFWSAACKGWPTKPLPKRYLATLESDIPALILSGGLDPVTPPKLGALTAQTFGRVVHVIAPHAGHTISALGCAPDLIAEFLTAPATAEVSGKCLQTSIARQPFALGPLGPDMTGDKS